MDRVERDIVHGEYQRLISGVGGLIPTVAFERVVVPARSYQNARTGNIGCGSQGILFINVLKSNAALDAADSETAFRRVEA